MWFFENPLPALTTGGLLVALCVVLALQTGRKLLLGLAGMLGLLTVAAVVIEQMVVTPGELVADRVYALAADLERNQPERIVEYISSRSPDLRRYALRVLKEVEIRDAAVKRNLSVQAFPAKGVATATFNGIILLDAPRHDIANHRHARRFVLTFRFEDGQWMVSDYREDSPLGPRSEI